MLARRGHQRCLCNAEGFGTLSRQLGNDEGYSTFGGGVSGRFTPSSPIVLRLVASAAVEGPGTRETTSAGQNTDPKFDAWKGSAPRSDEMPQSSPGLFRPNRCSLDQLLASPAAAPAPPPATPP